MKHWRKHRPFLENVGVNAELPLLEFVHHGYTLLHSDLQLRGALERQFELSTADLPVPAYFDAYSHRNPRSASFRSDLVAALRHSHRDWGCAAARLLWEHFSGGATQDIWLGMGAELVEPSAAVGVRTNEEPYGQVRDQVENRGFWKLSAAEVGPFGMPAVEVQCAKTRERAELPTCEIVPYSRTHNNVPPAICGRGSSRAARCAR